MPLLPIIEKSPFFRFLIFYAAGIASTDISGNSSFVKVVVVAVILILLVLQIVIANRFIGYYTGLVTGSLSAVILFLAGIFTGDVHAMRENRFRNFTEAPGYYRVHLIDSPQMRESSLKTVGRITHRMQGGQWVRDDFLILMYFELPGMALPEEGSNLLIKAALKKIAGPRNPGEFNYGRYLASRNIFRQVYLKKGTWVLTGSGGRSLRALAATWRMKMVNRLNTVGSVTAYRGLLAALTLGYREDLDACTKQIFSEAGVMHVMALSGFNVGLIALVLEYLLGLFSGSRLRIFNTLIIIFFLWFFAFLTGLSASVLRATVMISLVMAGRLFHRKINTYNMLFAAAFFLLAFSPGLLSDVSFQLSFSAVTGILLFQPLLYRKSTRGMIIDKLWQLFTLSCAAQLATFPVTLYYFHQFPVYFWLTNLYVVPLVSVIICVAGVFLLVTAIHPLAGLLGKILAVLLKMLYGSVAMVEGLPFSLIEHVYINAGQVALLFAVLLTGTLALYRKKVLLVYPVLLFFIAYQVTGLIHTYGNTNQKFMMVGNLKGRSVIIVKSGREAIRIADPGPVIPDASFRYSFGNFFAEKGIRQSWEFQSTDSTLQQRSFLRGSLLTKDWQGNLLMDCCGNRIVYLRDSRICRNQTLQRIKVDVAVVSGFLDAKPESVLSVFDTREIVLDASVKNYQAAVWKKASALKGIRCWHVSRDGAFLIAIHDSGRGN